MAKRKNSSRRKPGIFSIIFLLMNILAILALTLAYLSVHISPVQFRILPFFGLFYPYLLMANIGFIVFWALLRKWYFILSLTVVLSGWNHLASLYRFSGNNEFITGKKYLKLTSYNVKNLSNDNVDLVDRDVRDKIIGFLGTTGSDILCLQELMIVHPHPDQFIDSLSDVFGLPYHAYIPYSLKNPRRIDAIFTFSRFPIVRTGHLSIGNESNYAVYTDIDHDGDTFRLFNVHLESVRLKHEDYSFLSGLDLQFNKDEHIRENSLRIFKKLNAAFIKRAIQADSLAVALRGSPYPVLLCGDFNDTPNSYAYHRLARNLNDSFLESGAGFGNTYIGKVPSFRIDFIMHDDHFTSSEFQRETVRYSDHYPISSYIGWL